MEVEVVSEKEKCGSGGTVRNITRGCTGSVRKGTSGCGALEVVSEKEQRESGGSLG